VLIQDFQKGLNPKLVEKIWVQTPPPKTIDEWYKAAALQEGYWRRALAIQGLDKVTHKRRKKRSLPETAATACLSTDYLMKNDLNTSGEGCVSSVTSQGTYPQHVPKETRTTSRPEDSMSPDQERMHEARMALQRCVPSWQN